MDNQRSENRMDASRADRIASDVRDDGTLVEMTYDPVSRQTSFIVSRDGQWQFAASLESGERRIVPFSPQNNLLRSGALLLSSMPEEYGSGQELIREIQEYIHRYVDLAPAFRCRSRPARGDTAAH